MDNGGCLLFRNLKKDSTYGSLRASILQLLNEVVLLDMPLRERDVTIEGETNETKIALVYLRSKTDLEKTLKFVDSYDNRRRLTFNFDDIIEPSAHCAVIPIFHRPSRYYVDGETLTNVDGCNEFKSGVGAYINVQMRDELSKFICATLNIGKNRIFFVGVQENGCVVGVSLTPQKEDIIRKDVIEQAVSDVRPPVLSWTYKVDFIPIVVNGIVKDGFKVIEFTINKNDSLKQLYEVRGEFYTKRDGGKTEGMKPKDVQQWYQHIYEKEIKKKDEERKEILEKMDKLKGKSCDIL